MEKIHEHIHTDTHTHLSLERAMKSSEVHFVSEDEVFDLVEQGGVWRRPSHSLSEPLELATAGNLQVDLVPARGLEWNGGRKKQY